LQDSTITMAQAFSHGPSEFVLCPRPWLSVEDIEFYDFSSHCIYLKQEKSVFFPVLEKGGMFPFSWWVKPFVVLASGQPRYLAMFNSGLSNADWPVPCIVDLGQYPSDVLHIEWHWLLHGSADSRNDAMTRRALEEAGLYHGGLAVTLDAIHLVENTDSATISYSFTITNNDVDALYVVDPDLMGDGLFNYFNNGPEILRTTDATVYRTDHSGSIAPVPFDSWNPQWFGRLPSGASIQRVVTVPGYPRISSGSHMAEFLYNGPVNIDKAHRVLPDGRRWIGPTRSSAYALTVD
jgi:hypothetical protein